MRGMALLLAGLLSFGPAPVDEPARTADRTYEIVGRGYGHGRGMSQYGAYAAAKSGHGYRSILRFYYSGTRLVPRSSPERIRVLLTHDGSPLRIRAERGLQVWWTHQSGDTRYRNLPKRMSGCKVTAWKVRRISGKDMKLKGYSCRTWHTLLPSWKILGSGRVSFVPPDSTFKLRRWADDASSPSRRSYRGAVRIVIADGELRPINILGYNAYLRSVVPSEVWASWPKKTLRAQAIAARTYAARSAYDRDGSYFHVYDTTASQAYPGKASYDSNWNVVTRYEHERTTAAVKATSGRILKYGRKPAFTEFGASNGGRTASGGKPYLRSRKDKWDRRADPYRKWTDEVTAKEMRSWYPSLGKLKDIDIVRRSGKGKWGGRVREIELEGTDDTVRISGEDDVRIVLGLRSAWFRFR
jgi:stage II sporulation protein D